MTAFPRWDLTNLSRKARQKVFFRMTSRNYDEERSPLAREECQVSRTLGEP